MDKDFMVIYLRVVSGCNLNCTHCFTLGNQDPVRFTDINLIRDFLTTIRQNHNPKKVTLYLHGGETFLRPVGQLREIVKMAREILDETLLIPVAQTNLSYPLRDEIIAFIQDECNNEIGVSWDYRIRFGSIRTNLSLRQEEYFFSNLKRLIDLGVNVHIAITQQKYLLDADPIKVLESFQGVRSIDFELLTTFDEKTQGLKVNNQKWSDWFLKVVKYYHQNQTTWVLPQIDLLVKNIVTGTIQDCKCNCCSKRTLTLNPNGTVGFCPDKTYIHPVSNVEEMKTDWISFIRKAQDVVLEDILNKQESLCWTCEHYTECAGNCDSSLFDETDECPLSRQSITYVKQHLPDFIRKLNQAQENLPELRINHDS